MRGERASLWRRANERYCGATAITDWLDADSDMSESEEDVHDAAPKYECDSCDRGMEGLASVVRSKCIMPLFCFKFQLQGGGS